MSEYLKSRGVNFPNNDNKAKLLVSGSFADWQINSNFESKLWSPDIQKYPELIEKIDNDWAPKAAKGWFPGPLARLENYSLSESGELNLNFSRTNFKDYYGTRSCDLLRAYGYFGISNPLSTSCVVLAADNQMLIGHKVSGDAAGSIDAIGGYVNPDKDRDLIPGKLNLFEAALREVMEETGLNSDEIQKTICLGLSYEYKDLCHPVLSFLMTTPLTADEVLTRKGEEIDVLAVDTKPYSGISERSFINVLKKYHPNVEPDGRITMALAQSWNSGRSFAPKVFLTPSNI